NRADVGGPEPAGRSIKGQPPDVTQAIGEDLRPCSGATREWIVRRDGVRLAVLFAIDVDAQDFAEDSSEILAVVVRIVGRTAVAHSDVQKPVRAEADRPAVVVPKAMFDPH